MNHSVAVIAAHPDDEVLGCGGTIAKWANEGCDVNILLMTSGEGSRQGKIGRDLECAVQARLSAAERSADFLNSRSVTTLDFPDNRMSDSSVLEVVQAIEAFIDKHRPRIVLTHHAGDVNVDHRITHDAVLAACRPQPGFCVQELLFFEVASSTEWNTPASRQVFSPTYFCDISDTLKAKLTALDFYKEEMRPFPHPRSIDGVKALANWRGCSIGVSSAEAFMVGRIIR